MNDLSKKRVSQLRRAAKKGLNLVEAAERIGMPYNSAWRLARKAGIKFEPHPHAIRQRGGRTPAIAFRFTADTLREIDLIAAANGLNRTSAIKLAVKKLAEATSNR